MFMFKLKLKNLLSYSGVVSASERNPFVEVKTKEQADEAIATGYFDIVEVAEKALEINIVSGESGVHTAASLKKLNAESQKSILDHFAFELNNNEEANNEDERIALILKLQEEKQAGGE